MGIKNKEVYRAFHSRLVIRNNHTIITDSIFIDQLFEKLKTMEKLEISRNTVFHLATEKLNILPDSVAEFCLKINSLDPPRDLIGCRICFMEAGEVFVFLSIRERGIRKKNHVFWILSEFVKKIRYIFKLQLHEPICTTIGYLLIGNICGIIRQFCHCDVKEIYENTTKYIEGTSEIIKFRLDVRTGALVAWIDKDLIVYRVETELNSCFVWDK